MPRQRCPWVDLHKADYVAYHDHEWGVPIHDDRLLFEFLILEGAQAGLSWYTVLRKREHYRLAFDHFDPEKIASYDCVLIATHHKAFDWQQIADNAKLIVDTRNATRNVKGRQDHIVRA